MAEFEEKECCDTKLSQCVAVVSTSCDNNVKASSDSQVKDQEDKPECILAEFRDRFGIVFDTIVRELSDRSFLNIALTERKMFEDLQPALRKRQTRMLMTPRQDTTFRQTLPIYGHREQYDKAIIHLRFVGPICFTGCCSPSLTVDEESLRRIRRYKHCLRLGDSVRCTVQLLDISVPRNVCHLHLKVVKSQTCEEHPLQLMYVPLGRDPRDLIPTFVPILPPTVEQNHVPMGTILFYLHAA